MLNWFFLLLIGCPGSEVQPPPLVEPAEEPLVELPSPTEERYAASHILIAHRHAVNAPQSAARSKAEALELAESIHQRIIGGEPLEELAKEHSDGPSGPRGGNLGVYQTGTMVPSFESAVASVSIGEIGPIAETPFGFHIVRRDGIVEFEVSHILVRFTGAWRSNVTRTKEEARTIANSARARIVAGEPFADVAGEISEDS
ncbi:MAG: hypothetical protein HN348_26340, partial [Proteobacteria bacterium]|nr:hypothetical protein [Pseudomonadota bacterium]